MQTTTISTLRLSARILRSPTPNLFLRSMTSSSAQNASGLTPEESKALKERQVQSHESKIVESIQEMYRCKPTPTTYDVYAQNAVFHDPIGYAEGRDSITAQFNALAKLFPRADIPKFRVLQNPPSLSDDTILIDQDVDYYRDASSSSPTKTVNSLLTIQTNDSRQIVRHTEEWNHNRETSKEDGFFGMLNEQRKKITAGLTDMFTSKEPPKKE